MTPIVLIPARMASGRLPGKPLADIGGKPMIVHVAERAREADIGRVVVATDTAEIAYVCAGYGIETVMTRADHPSGSDRIHEALVRLDPDGKAQIIVNLQGDLPTIAADTVRAVVKPLENNAADIATLCCPIVVEEERTDPNVVKVVGTAVSPDILRALYFTRSTAPYGDGPLYHHIGIYAYRRESLDRFVTARPTQLEQRERLEQLRALEIGLRIDAAVVQAIPLGVDTPDQLQRAREMLGGTGR